MTEGRRSLADEMAAGALKYGPIVTVHDGYARLLGEVEELGDEVHTHPHNPERLRAEALQVAAVAMRMILELGLGDEP